MRGSVRVSVVLAVISLAGCAGGPILVEPEVSAADVQQAGSVLSRHQLEPSRNPDEEEMWSTIERVHGRLWPAILATCRQVFSHNCEESMRAMDIGLVQDETVNAYADSEKYVIGIHTGLMRSVGSDDELAWVMAHEAGHLLFGHAHKKIRNALGTQVLAGAIGIAIASKGYGNHTEEFMNTGWQVGYLAYSPDMELEADQFAVHVLKRAQYRPEASLSMIVRLHRGAVPIPVRRGEGWAGYLDTHPADDYRLAAMQSTIDEIRQGSSRPVSKEEVEGRKWRKVSDAIEANNTLIHRTTMSRYVPRLSSSDRECVSLAQEYSKCGWWDGKKAGGLFLSSRCPTPAEVGIETWNECFPHEQEDWNVILARDSQTERCRTAVREYPECKWWDGGRDTPFGDCPPITWSGGWGTCRRFQ